MEQYKKWLEEQIEKCLNDKDLQREHWAYCTAYKKLIEALPIHGVVRGGVFEMASIPRADDYIKFMKEVYTPNTPTDQLSNEGEAKGVSDGHDETHTTIRDGEFDWCMACNKQVKRA